MSSLARSSCSDSRILAVTIRTLTVNAINLAHNWRNNGSELRQATSQDDMAMMRM
jgi:hypothetical protein